MFQNKPMQLLATLVTLLAALPICAQTPVKSDDLAAQFAALDQKVKAASPAVSDQRALTTHASDKDDSKEAEKADRESDRELKQFLRHVLLQAKDRSLVEGEPTDAPVGKRGVRPSRLEEILNLPAQKISDNSSGRSNMRERFFAYGSSICELGVFLDQSRQNFAELDETGLGARSSNLVYKMP
jgi:hypothetical protein